MELLNIESFNSIVLDDVFEIDFSNTSNIIIDYSYPTQTFSQTINYILTNTNFVETIENLEIVDNISFIKFDKSKIITKTIDNE